MELVLTSPSPTPSHDHRPPLTHAELDALGDDFGEEEEGIPSYLREDATELPDFVDEPPVSETVRCLFACPAG